MRWVGPVARGERSETYINFSQESSRMRWVGPVARGER